MKTKALILILAVAAALLASGCQKDEPVAEPEEADIQNMIADAPVDPYVIAKELVDQAGWDLEKDINPTPRTETGSLLNYRRQVIAGSIVHYSFQVQMGSHPLDRIGIHRVVREGSAGKPVKTDKVFFYQHGDAKDFQGMMLPGVNSATTPDEFGMAVFLAQNDVDVWGIDQAWATTPKETTDFSFMTNWGIQKQVTDLREAMSISRITRFLTGNGLGRVILGGYSSGVVTGFATLNEETQRIPAVRHVKAFIPIDLPIKTDNAGVRTLFENWHLRVKPLYESGQFADFIIFNPIGTLARTNPSGASPIVAGLTNLQVALFFAAGQVNPPPTFHYLAGVWENNFPVGLQFLTTDQWFDFLISATPYEAVLFQVEYPALVADILDLPFDDHFSEIKVPILNVCPAGGFGEFSKYGISKMGSTDVTHLVIKLKPDDQALFDFAHIDLFIANNAPDLAWQPVLNWINNH